MQEIPTMVVVAAALVGADGRVLLQRRPDGRQMAGLWEFPGGKVEPAELPESALARELREELGVEVGTEDLQPACFASARVGAAHMVLLLYLCRRWQGEPRPLHASAIDWVSVADMRALDMPPADRPLIDLIEALLQAQAPSR